VEYGDNHELLVRLVDGSQTVAASEKQLVLRDYKRETDELKRVREELAVKMRKKSAVTRSPALRNRKIRRQSLIELEKQTQIAVSKLQKDTVLERPSLEQAREHAREALRRAEMFEKLVPTTDGKIRKSQQEKFDEQSLRRRSKPRVTNRKSYQFTRQPSARTLKLPTVLKAKTKRTAPVPEDNKESCSNCKALFASPQALPKVAYKSAVQRHQCAACKLDFCNNCLFHQRKRETESAICRQCARAERARRRTKKSKAAQARRQTGRKKTEWDRLDVIMTNTEIASTLDTL